MLVVLKNELYKLVKGKKLYVSLAIILIVSSIIYGVLKFAPNAEPEIMMLKESSAIELGSFILSVFTQALLGILGIVFVADIISEDYKQGTLKYIIMQPISRVQILIAKTIALLLYIEILLIFIYGIHILSSIFLLNKTIGFSDALSILYRFVMSAIPLMGFFSICIFVGLTVNGVGPSIGANIGIMTLLQILYQALGSVREYNIYGYLTMFSNTKLPVAKGIMVSLAYLIVFITMSTITFRNRDVLA